jgi:hypothetical protein
MRTFVKPLPTSLSASADTFANDVNKIVEALAEIRSAVPSTPGDVGGISVDAYQAIVNRVAALEVAVTNLETPPVSVPGIPTITAITAGSGFLTVSFNPPSYAGISPITKYIVTTSTGKVVEGTSSPITVSGLTNGVSVYVTIKAVNPVGSGAATSPSAPVVPAAVTQPTAVNSLSSSVSNGSVTLSWLIPSSDGGSLITGYRLTRVGGSTVDVAATQRTYTFAGLTNGTPYSFTVAAINANGVGPTTTVTATPLTSSLESKKMDLLGVSTGFASRLPFNSGVNPARRGGRYGSPDGYEYLNGVVATQRGVPFDVRHGYQYNNRSVNDTDGNGWNDLTGMQVLDWFDSAYPAILGMPMFPNGGTYAAAANGSYDAQYVKIGQAIKAKRPSGAKVVLRLDWEFNYGTRASSNLTNWNNAWRRAVTKIREGAGDRVKFSWSIAANTSSLSTLKGMYPGNDYVDVVGIDTYDAFINVGQGYHTEADWLQWTGISDVFAWAKTNEKLVAFDEWGGHNNNPSTNHSGGDNPDFPRIVLEWCRKNADWVAYECQFNDEDAGNVMNNYWSTNGATIQLPNQRAAYIAKIKSMVPGSTEAQQARDLLVKGVDKPDAFNTGVFPGTTFTVTSSHTPVSGTTYRNLDIRNTVTLSAKSNVTYINCIFRGATSNPTSANALVRAWPVHGGGHKFIDCTFQAQVPHHFWNGIMGYGFTVTRCSFSDVTDGIDIFNNNDGPAGSGDNSLRNGPSNVVVEQSYFHDLAWFNGSIDTGAGAIGSHSDCIQYQGGTGASIVGNTFTGMIGQQYGPNSYGTYTCNATLLIKPDVGLISGLTLDKNWIDGGSISVNINHDAPDRYLTNLGSITNNKFGRNQRIQASTPDTSYTISMPRDVTGTFTGNVYEDNGNAVFVRNNN